MKGPPPWCFPVPLVQGTCVPLHDHDARFNVYTDLGRIPAFGYRAAKSNSRLLLADNQTCVDANGLRRRGSCRAGTYLGRYLKGIGRTQLAENWNDPRDMGHGTGHLTLSGGAREYLTSRYMAVRNRGNTLVNCRGILVGAVGAWGRSVSWPRGAAPCDRTLQAITVRDDPVARFSNMLWYLVHPSPTRGIAPFFQMLALSTGLRAKSSDIGPEDLVAGLERAIRRGVENFRHYFECGVTWHSVHNNFSLDGRFLDAEIATITGRPFIGQVRIGRHLPVPAGFEVFDYLREVGHYLEAFSTRLQELVDWHLLARPVEAAFTREFLSHFRLAFSKRHLARSPTAMVERWLSWVDVYFDPSASARRSLRRLALRQALAAMSGRCGPAPQRVSRRGIRLGVGEWGEPVRLWELAQLRSDQYRRYDELARELACVMEPVLMATDVDGALKRIQCAETWLGNHWHGGEHGNNEEEAGCEAHEEGNEAGRKARQATRCEEEAAAQGSRDDHPCRPRAAGAGSRSGRKDSIRDGGRQQVAASVGT